MSRATEQAAKAARLAAARRQSPAAGESAPALPPRTERIKPVRMTLDLAPPLHEGFDDWTRQTSRQLGLGRVGRADVLRVLLRQLLDDEDLQRQVIEQLRSQQRDHA